MPIYHLEYDELPGVISPAQFEEKSWITADEQAYYWAAAKIDGMNTGGTLYDGKRVVRVFEANELTRYLKAHAHEWSVEPIP